MGLLLVTHPSNVGIPLRSALYNRAVSVGYLFQRRKGASPPEACMDASRLNSLDRSFSSVRSRRDLTRLLYGLVLAARDVAGAAVATGASATFSEVQVACATDVPNSARSPPCDPHAGAPCCARNDEFSCPSRGSCRGKATSSPRPRLPAPDRVEPV